MRFRSPHRPNQDSGEHVAAPHEDGPVESDRVADEFPQDPAGDHMPAAASDGQDAPEIPAVEIPVPAVENPPVEMRNPDPVPPVPDAIPDDDTVLADLVPRPAAPRPEADDRAEGAPRHLVRDFVGVFQDVECSTCGAVAGQIKHDPRPGDRDEPTWFMRVKVGGKWGARFPHFRRRQCQVIGHSDKFAREWVQKNKTCCAERG